MAERRYAIGKDWTTSTDNNGAKTLKVTAWRDDAQYAVGSSTPSNADATLTRGVKSGLITVPSGSKLYLRHATLSGVLTDIIQVEDADALKTYVDGAPAVGVTVAQLPAASAANAGATALVTDANSATISGTVAGGGSTKTMVQSTGAAWKIVGGAAQA